MFRWTLTNDDTGAIEVLKTDPHGWEEVALEHNRSERYDGIFLDFSLELSFHCKGGGKEFLDDLYKAKGSEGKATILVEFLCEGHFRQLFEGRIDFSSYREEFRGKTLHTVVDIESKGITQVVLSRDDMDVDLLATESVGGVALNPYVHAPYDMTLHSKTIYLQSTWNREVYSTNSETYFSGRSVIPTGATRRFFHTQPVPLRIQDLEDSKDWFDYWNFSSGNVETSGITEVHDSGTASPLVTPGLYRWSVNTSGVLNWISYTGATSGTFQITFTILQGTDLTSTNFLVQQSVFSGTQSGSHSVPYDINLSGTTNVQTGEKIWIYWFIAYIATGGTAFDEFAVSFDVGEFHFDINIDSTIASSSAKVIAIHEAWSRVAEGITDQTLAFKSEFFGRTNSQGLKYSGNGYASFTAITDGLRIRGFEQSDNAILTDGQTKKGVITNLKDIYDSCNAIWGIGLGIETVGAFEVVRVEEKGYFYQNTEIYKISNIPGIEMAFQEDMAFSEVELGFKKWRVKAKGGLDEPNSLARWVFPKIKNIKNKKVLVSPYIGGMYALEWTRRHQLKFKGSEDTDYDDDIFIIALNRNVDRGTPSLLNFAERGWMLGQGIFDNILVNPDTLLAPDTAYNLRFNLFSNFDRTMNQFTTNLTKDAPQQINYSYLEGNGQMEFQVVGFQTPDTHVGNLNNLLSNNVQNTEIPNGRHQRQYPILLPELYTFSFPVPYSDYLDILSNPYGYISFSSTNKNHKKGYIKTLSYNIARQMADFSLIRKFE